MAKIFCIANQKGGVGKTTTTVNLSAALAQLGNKVLVLDMDPQGNASSGLGIKKHETQDANIYHVLIGEKSLQEAVFQTNTKNLWIATANPDLVGAEIELVDMPQREYRLKNALSNNFKKGKSYEAEPGKHDDLVMALVLFAWLTTDTFFKNINDLDVMHTLRDLSDEQIDKQADIYYSKLNQERK